MKIKVNGFIHLQKNWDDNYSYEFFTNNLSEHGYMPVCPHVIEVDLPDDFDPRLVEIKYLEERNRALRLKVHEEIQKNLDRISKLQAIEYSPGAEHA